MTEWKAAPRGARDVDDALWARFRAAQDAFFQRRSGVFAERDAEQVAQPARQGGDHRRGRSRSTSAIRARLRAAIRDLQARFDEVGHVPRDAMRRLDEQMRAAEQRVRDAVDAEWRRGSAESNPFLAQLRERLVEAEAKLERAQKSGDRGADRQGPGRRRSTALAAAVLTGS